MATCRQCGRPAPLFATLCDSCIAENGKKAKQLLETAFDRVTDPRLAPDEFKDMTTEAQDFSHILVSTETVSPWPDSHRFGVVNGTCIFGQHLGRDVLNIVTDITGGRASSAEKLFAEARSIALRDLRAAAHQLGATAVIAVKIEHRDLTGGGKSMIMVSASGTAIRSGSPS